MVDVDALYKCAKLYGDCFCDKICMLYSLVTGFACPSSDSFHKELEWLIGIESELRCIITTFATSAVLADYFCVVTYISSDGHFSKGGLDCLWQLFRAD